MAEYNGSWKDFLDDDTPGYGEGDDTFSKMTDEELDAYLKRLDVPDSSSGFEETMVSGRISLPDGFYKHGDDENQATSVIPNDVKSISEITKKQRLVSGEPEKRSEEDGADSDGDDDDDNDYHGRDFRPIRRRRQPRTGCMGGIMYVAFIIGISVILACFAWLAINDVLALTKEEISATIEISDNWNMDELVDELKQKGIIDYKPLFKLYASFAKAETKIEPGTYVLSTKLDYWAIVSRLQSGSESALTVDVTIPEGLTLRETFELLESKKVCSAEELWEAAANYEFEYDFLDPEQLGNENRLEGYLFPDTYGFYVDGKAETVIKKFLNNFESKVTEPMRRQAANMGMTLNEILTVASLIEKEAANDEERPTIASVIYNRLNDEDYPFLDIDASIIYALGEHKEDLTSADLAVDSPYNTRLNPGLPPGPIANSGLSSIEAALNPEETDYYFYALGKEGSHRFFETYPEHVAFVDSDEYGG